MAIDYLKKDCSASSTLPFHVKLSLDIHNYKLQTKTVLKGYFTEVELFLFSFCFFVFCKLSQLKRVLLQITSIYSQMKGCHT